MGKLLGRGTGEGQLSLGAGGRPARREPRLAGVCLVWDTVMPTARQGLGCGVKGDQWLRRANWRGIGLGHSGAAGLEAAAKDQWSAGQDPAGWRGLGPASEQS